jgi:hypothetical protein
MSGSFIFIAPNAFEGIMPHMYGGEGEKKTRMGGKVNIDFYRHC